MADKLGIGGLGIARPFAPVQDELGYSVIYEIRADAIAQQDIEGVLMGSPVAIKGIGGRYDALF